MAYQIGWKDDFGAVCDRCSQDDEYKGKDLTPYMSDDSYADKCHDCGEWVKPFGLWECDVCGCILYCEFGLCPICGEMERLEQERDLDGPEGYKYEIVSLFVKEYPGYLSVPAFEAFLDEIPDREMFLKDQPTKEEYKEAFSGLKKEDLLLGNTIQESDLDLLLEVEDFGSLAFRIRTKRFVQATMIRRGEWEYIFEERSDGIWLVPFYKVRSTESIKEGKGK